jgi:NADH-quinone oxidoreductase subunit N
MKALALMVLLFSLAGVPPMLGFIGKFYVLKAAIDAHMYWLALLAVIASVIGAVYHIRIVYLMYFGKENEGLDTGPMGVMPWVMLMGSAAITLLGIINLFGVEGLAQAAAMSLVQ